MITTTAKLRLILLLIQFLMWDDYPVRHNVCKHLLAHSNLALTYSVISEHYKDLLLLLLLLETQKQQLLLPLLLLMWDGAPALPMAPSPWRADLQAAAARRLGGGRRETRAARRSSSSDLTTTLDVGGVGPVSSLPLPAAASGRRRLDSNMVILMDRWATLCK